MGVGNPSKYLWTGTGTGGGVRVARANLYPLSQLHFMPPVIKKAVCHRQVVYSAVAALAGLSFQRSIIVILA